MVDNHPQAGREEVSSFPEPTNPEGNPDACLESLPRKKNP
jgi:hypothetical protein